MALTENQVNDFFQKQLGRPATPFEYTKYAGSDLQRLANIGSEYQKLNINESVSDYLQHKGQDPSLGNRMKLGQEYGIGNIGSYEGNVALFKALKQGNKPQGQVTPPSVQGTVQGATQGTTAPIPGATPSVPGSVSGATPQNSANTVVDPVKDALNTYQTVQKQIADIDNSLASALQNKKDEVVRSGGIVDEAQLRSIVLAEKAPLLAQRRDLASQQAVAGKTYQNLLAQEKATQKVTSKLQTAKSKLASGTASTSDIDEIANAIVNGHQPPTLTGLYGKSAAVRAALERQGYNLTKATQDWTATQKYLATLNGAQQTRLRQATSFAYDSLDLVDSLSNEMKGILSRSGVTLFSKANLIAAKNGIYGADAKSIATRLDNQISDLTSELATVYKGGNSSTDESLKLASKQLNSSWDDKTLKDNVNLVRKNLQIRRNSLQGSTAGITDSQYSPSGSPETPESSSSGDTGGGFDPSQFF